MSKWGYSCYSAGKNSNVPVRQRGFILLSVIVAITLLAAIAFMLGFQGGSQTGIATGEIERDQLRYVAEAGLAHAKMQLSPSNTCDSYTDIPSTSFAAGSYTANVSPTEGSPVSVTATGILTSGALYTLRRDDVKIYDANTIQTIILQPGIDGNDAEIWDQMPNNNYGDSGETWVSSASNDTTRSLLRFNIDAVPDDMTVLQATLSLLRRSGSGADQPVSAHRIMNAWSEGSVTWNSRAAGTNWDTAGSDFDDQAVATTPVGPANVRYEWDITRLVQGWVDGSYPNYGVALVAAIAGMPGERFYTGDESDPGKRPSLSVTYICECGKSCAEPEPPDNVIYLSTDSDAELGGLSFLDTDVAQYDRSANSASLYLDSVLAGLDMKVDALHILENGNIILSTQADTTFGGLTFKSEDLIEYDPVTGTATMYLEAELHFQSMKDIISVHVLDNGNTVLSVNGNAVLGGLAFSDRDLVEYNRFTGKASIYFDGDATTLSQRISALHILANGHLVLAPEGDTTLGGLSVGTDQLVDYDPGADSATLFFDGATLFTETSEKVRSVHIGAGSGSRVPTAGTPNLLFVVGSVDGAGPTTEELAHQSLIESWGYSVELIDDSASQAAFDSAASRNDVAFITNDIMANMLGTKLVNASIGVVTSEDNLSDEFGLSSSIGWGSASYIGVVNNTHYITLPFETVKFFISSASESLAYLTGTLSPDLGLLAEAGGGNALVTLEAGARTYAGGITAGRRVQLPWGGNGFDPNRLTTDGLTILRRALEWGAGAIVAPDIDLSTDSDATLGGLSFQDTDIARYQTTTDMADLYLDSVVAGLDKKVDALHILANGHLILSTQADATFGGLDFRSEDLIEYDPVAGTATMYLEADVHFDSKKDIISVHILDNGNAVLSTSGDAILGGLAFSDRDLVEYDRNTGTASIFFDGDATTLSQRISALHILDNGNLILAPEGDTTLGGLDFGPDQLVEYNPTLDLAFVYFDGETLFSETSEKVRSVHIGPGSGGGGGGGTYLDEFNAVAYNGNDGNLDWTNDWQELGESDGPTSGRVHVVASASACSNGNCLRIGGTGVSISGRAASRESDLSGATSASLSFNIARSSSGGGNATVAAEISGDGGTTWTVLDTYSLVTGTPTTPTPQTFDISSHIAANTQVRFIGSGSLDDPSYIYVDDVRIDLDGGSGGGGGGGGGGGTCDGTFRDEFNAQSFSGTDGTLSWTTDWVEVGESDGATSGDTQVTSDQSNYQLRTRDNNNGGEGVERAVDISGATSATLSYDYRREGLDSSSDYTSVEVSANGASGPWTELTRHQGSGSDSSYQAASHNISSFLSTNTRVRFITSSSMGGSDVVWFDNIEIACAP